MLPAETKPSSQVQPRLISLSSIFAFACLAQILSIVPLWGHISDSTAILGRYSSRYAFVLVLNLFLLAAWPILFLCRQRIHMWLTQSSSTLRYGTLLFIVLVMLITWLIPVEEQFAQFVSLNGLLFAVIIIYTLSERPYDQRWRWLIAAALAFLLVAMFSTTLIDQNYSPDEAHWADYASSNFRAGGVYARTWLQEPIIITPGLGWSVAAYGWALEHIAFQLTTGRIWNFIFNLLAVIGIFAVAWRLYGYKVGLISAGFALLSRAFIPIYDYRPDHQLTAMAMLITFAALQARHSLHPSRRWLWHIGCGLFATLSLQLHAAGIVFAAAFSLFYLADYCVASFHHRRLTSPVVLLAFGIGSLTGALIYYYFNILPVGGLQPFLSFLVATRWLNQQTIALLGWPSYLEGVIIFASLAFVLWRRTSGDYQYLSIIVCLIMGILIFDRQGYFSTFRAFYVVPIGALFAEGIFPNSTHRSLGLSTIMLGVLAFAMIGNFINWGMVGTIVASRSIPPSRYEAIRSQLLPYLREDDVVVSSHTLIWAVPDQPNLISYTSELNGMKRWNFTRPVAVWERVKPTVIVWIDNQIEHNPGLDAYMTEQHFAVCNTIQTNQLVVHIYRSVCS